MAAGLVKGDVRSFTYAQTSSDRADWSASCNIGSRRTFDRRHRVMSASTRPDATYGQRRMAINRAHRVRGGARLDLPGPADEAHGPNRAFGGQFATKRARITMSGVPWLPSSRPTWPSGPLSEAKTRRGFPHVDADLPAGTAPDDVETARAELLA